MKLTIPENILNQISEAGIIAVLEIDSEEHAVPLAKALLEGGITMIELALRTPASFPSIALIAKEVPQMKIGIGTIIEAGQAAAVKKEPGVLYGVSPGTNLEIIKEAITADLPFIPGIATPSDLCQVISLGCRVVKFFPADGMGGLNYLKSINAPYNHLGVKYIPLGGISPENLASYVKFAPVLAIGGSWIANKELIQAQDWDEITERAREAIKIWNFARS